jgi:hypothetical protein
MADVTPEALRSTVYAFDRSFEGEQQSLDVCRTKLLGTSSSMFRQA